ncbi:Glu-tRNA(Gln) amidotransferase GatDE subunit D [Candidatus Woesearchaeota archaeon]|jgi:glutamyl-tRNA(Gln) amidotransferase subunit D|nr:Glu-tRNA(Gln) amidotransferase GatDE subunit D [Candidatus Woesearchaeota archaeon]MDP6648115.1 Glu-tRNA(Gln) amidotransferase subunit GatD [Candidatus Woesearchaeota archaeon]|tara:strand:- start:68132 stop:69409 length:1278 start_codon:yes stop_codon:yes gene_type:complete
MKPEYGDVVKVHTKEETFEGILMPNKETDSVVIKLDNGYNIGIDDKKIKEIKVVKKFEEKEDQLKNNIKKDDKKPTITILHTGGTIASKVNYETGGVISKFSPAELLEMFPELKKIANFDSRLIEQMFSEDMRFVHYEKITHAIKKEIEKNIDGIIITHGTDTLAYTSAALSFILENIDIPVILVGAQRSSDRGSSDAVMNLICAAEFIAKTDFTGVAICMHEKTDDNNSVILPPCKTRKMHTSRRDAFKAINDKPIAVINYDTRSIKFMKKDYQKSSDKKLVIRDSFGDKIGIIKCHPNMFKEQFDFFKGYEGLIIEGTGLGHAPVDPPQKLNIDILESIKSLIKSGTIVAMTSQCIFGRTHPHVYTAAINLSDAGVIYCKDMLTETAFIKLAWLLGNYKKEEVRDLLTKNLRGEINERITNFI